MSREKKERPAVPLLSRHLASIQTRFLTMREIGERRGEERRGEERRGEERRGGGDRDSPAL